jgi:hypothetical protein
MSWGAKFDVDPHEQLVQYWMFWKTDIDDLRDVDHDGLSRPDAERRERTLPLVTIRSSANPTCGFSDDPFFSS